MPFICTTATRRIAKMKKRIRAIPGGTSAGKTISVLQILIDLAQTDTVPTVTSVCSESVPHLKLGAMRDFLHIMQDCNYFDPDRWNATDRVYEFETKSKIEFFPYSEPKKCRGPRRGRLFVNEANHCDHESFDQLAMRTSGEIFIDWNPSEEFWYYDLYRGKPEVEELTLTYLDNEGCPPETVKFIESKKDNLRWWKVYGLGELGTAEGRIYKDWKVIDEIPHEARLVRRGLDFGYSSDPSAMVDIYSYNGGYIIDEVCYRRGMTNDVIANLIKSFDDQVPVYADSAEPKSIDEISGYGVPIYSASKGKGSISQGIQFVQAQRISVTERSVNLIKEYRNYFWGKDVKGRETNEPSGIDHALDAVRYGFSGLIRQYHDEQVSCEVPSFNPYGSVGY